MFIIFSNILTPFKTPKSFIVLIILTAAGVAGNHFGIPLYSGVEFLFGSAAVLLAVYLYGLTWGLVTALITGISAYFSSDSAQLLVVFPLEALFVGLFLRRQKENIIVADTFFWTIIGMPVMWFMLYGISHLNFSTSLFELLKLSVNGIINALLANLVVTFIPLKKWIRHTPAEIQTKNISLHQIVFNLLVAFVLLPTMIFMIMDNQREQKEMEAEIINHIETDITQITGHLIDWQQRHMYAVTKLAETAANLEMKPLNQLQESTESTRIAFPDYLTMYIGDTTGKTIAFSPAKDSTGKSTLGQNFSDRAYFKEVKTTGKPVVSDVFMGRISKNPVIGMAAPIFVKNVFTGFAYGSLDLSYVNNSLLLNSHQRLFDATVTDKKGLVIASTRPDVKAMGKLNRKNGEKRYVNSKIYHWLPADNISLPETTRWHDSVYIGEIPVGEGIPWKVTIELPYARYQNELQETNIEKLAGMLILSILALLMARFSSGRLTEPLAKLAATTTNLPVKLFLHQSVDWPATSIKEIESLVGNFQTMSGTLQHNFAELQAAIQRSEEDNNKLEAIIAGIGDGVSIQDTDFRVLYQNNVHIELIGQHIGEYCYKAYENRDEICEGCPLADSFKDGKIHNAERIVDNMYVGITSSPLKDATGKVISGIEVVRNITDRKRAEETMHRQKERLQEQLIFENALHQIAETIVANDNPQTIMEATVNIVGKALNVDRSQIYDIDFDHNLAIGMCEWLNPATPEIAAAIDNKITERRNWRQEEIEFLSAVARQVEIAIQKTRLIAERSQAQKIMQQQSSAMETSMDGMAILNPDGTYLYMNDAHAKMYGFDKPEELIGMHWKSLYNETELERFKDEILPRFYHDGRWRGESVGTRKDGSTFPQEISLTMINEDDLVCVVRDISERKKAEQLIWQEKERAQVTLHSIGDAVITTNADGIVEFLNPVAEDLTGWTTAEAKGLPLIKAFHIINEATGEIVENPVEKCIREGRIVGLSNHTALIHRDGHEFAIEDSASPIRDREGKIIGAILVFHDVSEKRSMLQQLIHQAHHDPLTGLPNRILFNDRLSLALAQAHRSKEMLAVLFMDLDRFKLVNDMLGHAMGDQLLKDVAARIKRCVRESDTVSRVGGDEFTLLLPQINHVKDVAKIAQKIITSLGKPWILSGLEFHVTTSIGIALFPNDAQDAETLLKQADIAMYRAKEQGRNNYQLFTPSMNAKIVARLSLENSLHRALKNNEFVIYYQPQVNTDTGQITGMEALVRWQHPEKGLIFPDQFISVAEDTGLIVPLGDWVLRNACMQNKAWQNAGFPPMRVTVNLSACQFKQKNLLKRVAQILRESELEPRWLELEITESIAMEDVELTNTVLNSLKEMGIQIAIDDFGTGYSSLSYLKRFPIHTLKIDRSFVRDITTDPEDAAIVTTVIVLAQNLNLKVIAEGVETEEQLAFLRQRQCIEMQGYLFSKPVPVNEFEVLIKKRSDP